VVANLLSKMKGPPFGWLHFIIVCLP
jgi:hypothetical protein